MKWKLTLDESGFTKTYEDKDKIKNICQYLVDNGISFTIETDVGRNTQRNILSQMIIF